MKINSVKNLNEGLTVEQAISQYTKRGISEEDIINVIQNDPTSKYEGGKAGDYTQWVLEKIVKGEKPTDVLFNNLAIFDKAKRKQNFTGKKDIFGYKTLSEFNDFMSQENVQDKTNVELTYGIKPIFKGQKYTLYQPKTYEQSCQLRGDDAVWCTGDHRTKQYWNEYDEEGDLIIFYNNSTNKPEYQIFIKQGEIEEIENENNDKRSKNYLFDVVGDDVVKFLTTEFKPSNKPIVKFLCDLSSHSSEHLVLKFYEQPNNKPSLLWGCIPINCDNYLFTYRDEAESDDADYAYEECDAEELVDEIRGVDVVTDIVDTLKFYGLFPHDAQVIYPRSENDPITIIWKDKVYKVTDTDDDYCGSELDESTIVQIKNSSILEIKIPSKEDLFLSTTTKNILWYYDAWWLSDSAIDEYTWDIGEKIGVKIIPKIKFVTSGGEIGDIGLLQNTSISYRPIIKIDKNINQEINIGECATAFGELWICIGEKDNYKVLLMMSFPEIQHWINNPPKKDYVYEESDAHKILQDWFKQQMNKQESLNESINPIDATVKLIDTNTNEEYEFFTSGIDSNLKKRVNGFLENRKGHKILWVVTNNKNGVITQVIDPISDEYILKAVIKQLKHIIEYYNESLKTEKVYNMKKEKRNYMNNKKTDKTVNESLKEGLVDLSQLDDIDFSRTIDEMEAVDDDGEHTYAYKIFDDGYEVIHSYHEDGFGDTEEVLGTYRDARSAAEKIIKFTGGKLEVRYSKEIDESLKESVTVYTSDEHISDQEDLIDKIGWNSYITRKQCGTFPKETYYGYATIEHPKLGEFIISISSSGKDIRTDGFPWKFLQSTEYKLTNAQIEYVKAHEDELRKIVRSDIPVSQLNESITEYWDDEEEDKYTLVGVDGNAYSVMGYTANALRREGLKDRIQEMYADATSSDYNHLLVVCMKYVDMANAAARGENLDESVNLKESAPVGRGLDPSSTPGEKALYDYAISLGLVDADKYFDGHGFSVTDEDNYVDINVSEEDNNTYYVGVFENGRGFRWSDKLSYIPFRKVKTILKRTANYYEAKYITKGITGIDESLRKSSANTKINIRESLNTMDIKTDNKYDLRNMYDASKMNQDDKLKLAKMISLNESCNKISNYLKKFI